MTKPYLCRVGEQGKHLPVLLLPPRVPGVEGVHGELAHMEDKVLQRLLIFSSKRLCLCYRIMDLITYLLNIFLPCTGLGTSTSNEAKDYFSDMIRHRIKFRYNGDQVGRKKMSSHYKN